MSKIRSTDTIETDSAVPASDAGVYIPEPDSSFSSSLPPARIIYHKYNKPVLPDTTSPDFEERPGAFYGFEFNTHEVITENMGYLSVEEEVKLFAQAGIDLAKFRAASYQYQLPSENDGVTDSVASFAISKNDKLTSVELMRQLNISYADKLKLQAERQNRASQSASQNGSEQAAQTPPASVGAAASANGSNNA